MRLSYAYSILAGTVVAGASSANSRNLRASRSLQSLGNAGDPCNDNSECTTSYCTASGAGTSGICVHLDEVTTKQIHPKSWGAKLNEVRYSGCHNCYQPSNGSGFTDYKDVVRNIPALELDIRLCDGVWVVGHDGCNDNDRYYRELQKYFDDIKEVLSTDEFQFPIMVNLDFKDTLVSGDTGDEHGVLMDDLIERTFGDRVFTKDDLKDYNRLESWDQFRKQADDNPDFWPVISSGILRNKVVFVANHIFSAELDDLRNMQTFFLAPSYNFDYEVSSGLTFYTANSQSVFGNLAENGGKCHGDLPRLLNEAGIITRCWDGNNPDTLSIPTQWQNLVAVATNHDIQSQNLEYKITKYEDSVSGEVGATCSDDNQCANGRCVHDICRAGVDGDPCEKDSDCDGLCGRGICSDGGPGDACGHDGDCTNGRCVDDICRAGVSGDPCEKDSDCNGLCGRGICSDGSPGDACGHDGDCTNGRCVDDICRAGVNGDPCEKDSDCDGLCGRGVCSDGSPGNACGHDGDCRNGLCVKDICRAGITGDPCERDSDCNNRRCVRDTCRAGRRGDICEKDSDCNSNDCDRRFFEFSGNCK